jgi:hypothetical protein
MENVGADLGILVSQISRRKWTIRQFDFNALSSHTNQSQPVLLTACFPDCSAELKHMHS